MPTVDSRPLPRPYVVTVQAHHLREYTPMDRWGWLASAGFAIWGAVGMAGCHSPSPEESAWSSPGRDEVVFEASGETTAQVGVVRWKVGLPKADAPFVAVTGYDADANVLGEARYAFSRRGSDVIGSLGVRSESGLFSTAFSVDEAGALGGSSHGDPAYAIGLMDRFAADADRAPSGPRLSGANAALQPRTFEDEPVFPEPPGGGTWTEPNPNGGPDLVCWTVSCLTEVDEGALIKACGVAAAGCAVAIVKRVNIPVHGRCGVLSVECVNTIDSWELNHKCIEGSKTHKECRDIVKDGEKGHDQRCRDSCGHNLRANGLRCDEKEFSSDPLCKNAKAVYNTCYSDCLQVNL